MKNNRITNRNGLDPAQYVAAGLRNMLDLEACLAQLELLFHPGGLSCPDCGSQVRIGHGKTAHQVPRFRCRECGLSYTILSGTPFSGTKLGPRRIIVFMYLYGSGAGVNRLAEETGLSVSAVRCNIGKINAYAL